MDGHRHARAVLREEMTQYPFVQQAGWASGPIWTIVGRAPAGIRWQLSLYVIKHHVIKMYGRTEVQFHGFLTAVSDEDGYWAARLGRFNPRQKR